MLFLDLCARVRMRLNDYVLVVADDDLEVLAAYVAMLEPRGFTVHTCSDGREAIELCRVFKPGVVVLDLVMPGLDGFATARHLQAETELADIRRVAVTAFTDERSSARAWEAGFHEFLPKPVPLSMLLAMVRPTRDMRSGADANTRDRLSELARCL